MFKDKYHKYQKKYKALKNEIESKSKESEY